MYSIITPEYLDVKYFLFVWFEHLFISVCISYHSKDNCNAYVGQLSTWNILYRIHIRIILQLLVTLTSMPLQRHYLVSKWLIFTIVFIVSDVTILTRNIMFSIILKMNPTSYEVFDLHDLHMTSLKQLKFSLFLC